MPGRTCTICPVVATESAFETVRNGATQVPALPTSAPVAALTTRLALQKRAVTAVSALSTTVHGCVPRASHALPPQPMIEKPGEAMGVSNTVLSGA